MHRLTLLGFLILACGGNTDLSGKWKTGFGTLELTQKGDSLLGNFEQGGKFSAVIKNDTVYFRITEASFTSANLEGFAIIKDKNNLKGKVKEENSKLYDGTFYMMRMR
ncbi:MAG: hypothetical protein ABIL16_04985 [candidate division WOR-3 bacterium]